MVASGWASVPGLLSLPLVATYNALPAGGWLSLVTSMLSMLGRPAGAGGLNRTVLSPAGTDNVRVLDVHAVQVPVLSNDTDCTVEPLTITSVGRTVVVPLANRTTTVAVPDADAATVNCAAAPAALVPLQNPLPEKPAQLESTVPEQVAGEDSASYRVVAACAADGDSTMSALASRVAHAMAGFR